MRRGRYAVAAAGVCAVLTGCTGTAPAPDGGSPSPTQDVIAGQIPPFTVKSSLPTPLYAQEWGLDWDSMVEAAASTTWQQVRAGGVVQAAACSGSGTPTVVYLNGLGSPAAWIWSPLAVEQSATNRVCLFDRPGMGLSPNTSDPDVISDPMIHAAEMYSLVEALDEPGPYLLVAWSYGGLVARAAGTLAPEKVAGLVLVDGESPIASYLLTDSGGVGTPGMWMDGGAPVDVSTAADTIGEGPDLGDRPVIVLQRGDRTLPPGEEIDWAEEDRNQLQATTISTNSLHAVVTDSDHGIPYRNPEAVLAATRAVSESVNADNAALPDCPTDLAASGVTRTPR